MTAITCLLSWARSVTGSNDPVPLQIEQAPIVHEETGSYEASPQIVQTPRKKRAIMKKCTPRRAPIYADPAPPTSPASNTRSKKKLQLNNLWFMFYMMKELLLLLVCFMQ